MNRRERHIATAVRSLAVLTLLAVASAFGQEASTNQTLTLQVFETNKIDINQRAVTLVINQASLETGSPIEATNEDGNLIWITNGENKKITVASNNAAPRFLVKVNALDISGTSGVAAPEVSLKILFAVCREKITERWRRAGALGNGLQKFWGWLLNAVIAQ